MKHGLARGLELQAFEQFSVQAAEAAVTEDADHIPARAKDTVLMKHGLASVKYPG